MWNKKRDKIFLFYIECGDGMNIDRKTDYIQLGLLSIATVLKLHEYQVQLFFDSYPDMDELKRLISWERVRMVGFYTAIDNIVRIRELTEFIKKTFPRIMVIYGGPQATLKPVELLHESKADIVVRYEGEYTMIELLDYFYLGKGSLEDILGITYRDGDKIKHNPDRPFIENLDELPLLDRDLLPYKEDYPSILTGRGCPYNCTFCFQGSGQYYRMRTVENVLHELDDLLSRYKDPLYIGFSDDTFTADPDRTVRLCREIKKRKELRPGFHWYAEGRANIFYQYPELIGEMRDSGLKVMQFGIESANEDILRLYKKMITKEQVEFTVRQCVEENIFHIVVSFILGGPFESRETIEESLNFAKKLISMAPGRIKIINGYLAPLPGTPIGDEPEKYGIIPLSPFLKTGSAGGRDYLSETVNLKYWELAELKQFFDREINDAMNKEINNIPGEQVAELFRLSSEGIKSIWYDMLSSNIALRRYFNFREHTLYKSIDCLKRDKSIDCLKREDITDYFPQRTDQNFVPVQDGIILDRYGKKYRLDSFKSRIFHLSAGRLKFKDIVNIISEEYENFSSSEEIINELIKFYAELDNIYGVVFSKI
jgi:radical SAM superfamily enzyme YgiQ (UPF0313 family)